VDAGGAGTLSLRQLAVLAPDFVKIDIPTLLGADSETPERTLGRVVIALAERMGTAVVGERIENQRDLPLLRYLGVRYGQGFLLAKPGVLPVDEKPIVELVGTGIRRPIWRRRFPPPWSPV
jgi:EAL domain-containing protein (putative c-di-GMP-specific phosphodiesterase class I)